MTIEIIKAADWARISAALPPVTTLLDPLIPAKGKTLLHGPPGSGKSALMWGLGNAIVSGSSYLNLATKQASVLLVSTDMNLYELKYRWNDAFIPLFDICCLPGFDATKREFTKSAVYTAIKRYVDENETQLVMFDALGGVHSGRSARDDEVADSVDHVLSQWLPESAILLLGHDRKQRFDRDGIALEPGNEDFLGSTKWRANATSQVHMWPIGEFVSKIQHAKCQVAQRLAEPIKLYIDIHGRAELWNEHRAKEVGDKYREAMKRLNLNDKMTVAHQVAEIAKHHNVSERTVRRWKAMSVPNVISEDQQE